MKSHAAAASRRRGRESETWILQDYGDIVLHVFSLKAANSTTSNTSGPTRLPLIGNRSPRSWPRSDS